MIPIHDYFLLSGESSIFPQIINCGKLAKSGHNRTFPIIPTSLNYNIGYVMGKGRDNHGSKQGNQTGTK